MSEIDTTQWKYFDILSLFDVFLADGDLQAKKLEDGEYPLISSGKTNNGICKNICKQKNSRLFQSSTITVDMFGKVFYQPKAFYAVGHGRVNMLVPKKTISEKSGLFISAVLERQLFTKYQFNDMCSSTSLKNEKIKLPVDINGNPNFAYMEEYMQNLESSVSSSLTALRSAKNSSACKKVDIQKWKQFKVEDIFPEIIKPEVYHTRQLIQDSNGIPYVVRSKFNNGIKYRVKKPIGKINPPNVISFGAENATFFYQQEEWVSGRDMYYIEVGNLSFYTCCFLTSVFQVLATKYSYNNGLFPEKLKKEKIMLPINENDEIDYKYMEEYMQKKFFYCRECLSSVLTI